ncbi:MAG: glycosyltransferase family 1 protein [Nanoarchaeota archaeon]|nr:MAG: glycosyltransferase family 1 protein [Nanoarchaeota archaeon]
MRIAFFAPEFYPPWGGVGTYSILLIKEMSKLPDTEIHVFTPRRGENYNPQKVREFFGNRITLHNISDANDTFVYNFHFQKALGAVFDDYNKKYKYDIIHSANLVHMPDILLKFRKQKIPSVVTAHTTIGGQVSGFLRGNKNFLRMAPSEKGSLLLYPLISSLEWYYLKRTPNLITPSETFRKIFEKRGYKGNTYVVRHGIDIENFSYENAKDKTGRFAGLKKIKEPIVLYAGRLISQKGLDIFVSMMKNLIERGTKTHFVIAGHGDEKNLQMLLELNKIPKNKYTFLGFVPNHELPWLYKKCNIFVLPSFYENFPISLMEAMAMRCVCVATDVGAIRELIDDKKDGFIVQAGDLKSLTEKVEWLLKNEADRKKLGIAAEKKVRGKFSSKVMAINTKKVYEQILGSDLK